MHRQLRYKASICALMYLVIIAHCITGYTAIAKVNIDTTKNVNITIEYKNDNSSMSNVSFYVYKIANMTESGTLHFVEDLKQLSIDLNSMTTKQIQNLAYTIYSNVQYTGLNYIDTGMTNTRGVVKFPSSTGVSMTPGLYLIVGDTVVIGDKKYEVEPTLELIPSNVKYPSYNLSVTMKSIVSQYKTTNYAVQKVWEHKNNENIPDSIKVNLLKNGELYDSVILTKDNKWLHVWENLEADKVYTVTEEPVDGYETSISRYENAYIITNTYIEDEDIDETKNTDDTITQTGQLWWPIITLDIVGMTLVLTGYILQRRSKREA